MRILTGLTLQKWKYTTYYENMFFIKDTMVSIYLKIQFNKDRVNNKYEKYLWAEFQEVHQMDTCRTLG